MRNYQSMEYLGPRLFDKIIFALVIMSLYFGIGDNFKCESRLVQSTPFLGRGCFS